MAFVILLVGVILVVVAINNTHGQFASTLESDLPGFFKWAIAIAAVLGLGFIPGFQKPSRWLLALVLVVIVLKNYSTMFAGLTSFAGQGATTTDTGTPAATPTAAFSANPATTTPPAPTQVAGDAPPPPPPSAAQIAMTQAQSVARGISIDPHAFMAAYSPSAGFGGMA
jgi:hypothetical protein